MYIVTMDEMLDLHASVSCDCLCLNWTGHLQAESCEVHCPAILFLRQWPRQGYKIQLTDSILNGPHAVLSRRPTRNRASASRAVAG